MIEFYESNWSIAIRKGQWSKILAKNEYVESFENSAQWVWHADEIHSFELIASKVRPWETFHKRKKFNNERVMINNEKYSRTTAKLAIQKCEGILEYLDPTDLVKCRKGV